MVMKKTEMEAYYKSYQKCMIEVEGFVGQGLFAKALERAFEAWEYVDGMMQYARKYHNREFDSIEAIDCVLEYAPLLFDFERLNVLEQMIKSCKRIERNTNERIDDRLSKARRIMSQAHKLWNYLELNPQTRQDQLAKNIGGDQGEWRNIVETWEKMGLLLRYQEGGSYRLNLQTRMGALTRGKCIQCGSCQEAPKAILLEPTKCPDCGAKVYFVILPS
jgi:hypothetical protein